MMLRFYTQATLSPVKDLLVGSNVQLVTAYSFRPYTGQSVIRVL